MTNDDLEPASDSAADGQAKVGGGKLARKIDTAKRWAEPHILRADESLPGRIYNRLLEIEFIDRSIALAAKAFIAFFPLLVAIVFAIPDDLRPSVTSTIVDRFGLDADSAAVFTDAFSTSDGTEAAIGFFGLIMLFLYATSFTTALQRIYLRAWRRPPGGGLRNNGRGLAWLAGIIILVGVNGLIARVLAGPAAGGVIRMLIALATSIGIWWWTAHTMLRGEVRWRPLLPGAVVTGIGLLAYALTANFWMPRMVESNAAQFGFFGVSLAIVSWFVGIAFVVVVGAALGPTLSEGDGRFAIWLRSPSGTVLNEGSAAAKPAPTQRLRLASALGIGTEDEDDS